MAKTLLDLATRLDKIAAGIDAAANEVAKGVVMAVTGDLAFHTPVDTSKALSNWQVTIGSPAQASIGPFFPGSHGSTYKASAQEAINAAKAVLVNKKPGQSVFITNVVPYIRRLNDGYSKQVPAGFVERAALVGRKTLENTKLKIKE